MSGQFFSESDSNGVADLAADVRLCMVDGVGPKLRRALLDRFGSAAGVFAAAPSSIRDVPGIGVKAVRDSPSRGTRRGRTARLVENS
ncbi:MAG: helix-hairpin-helix domain-containing protein [Pirellulales bacterium]